MRTTIYFLFSTLLTSVNAQVDVSQCNNGDESTHTNFCCGNDPNLKWIGQNGQFNTTNKKLLDNQNNGANFCDDGYFDFNTINSVSPIGINTDWFLVWDDQFNKGSINESFYKLALPWSNVDLNGMQIFTKDNVNVDEVDEKLKLTAKYVSDAAPNIHYTGGMISSHMHWPLNSRFQTSNKLYPNPNKTWPALWLLGGNSTNMYQEIDIYEVVNDPFFSGDNGSPQTSLKMTFHATEYSYIGNKKHEGIHYETGEDLTTGFHQYDLIWDKWKMQWWYDGEVVHEVNKYYHIPSSWGTNDQNKRYRENPMHNYSDFTPLLGDRFAFHKFVPSVGSYPMKLIFGFGLLPNVTPADVGPGKTQEMDYLKIWLRKSCTNNNTIYSANYLTEGTIIETGYNITTNPGSQILLTGSSPQTNAIYAGLNEIAFNNGFSVDPGANFFAFLTSCESAWDQRPSNNTNQAVENLNVDVISSGDIVVNQNEATINSDNRKNVILNYTTDNLEFSCTGSDIYAIKIYDMKGQLIYENNPHSQTVSLRKSQFVSGIYTSIITSAAGTDVRKIWIVN